jgi:hypothetical protein
MTFVHSLLTFNRNKFKLLLNFTYVKHKYSADSHTVLHISSQDMASFHTGFTVNSSWVSDMIWLSRLAPSICCIYQDGNIQVIVTLNFSNINVSLMNPHKEKSNGFRSGEHGDQMIKPPLPITRLAWKARRDVKMQKLHASMKLRGISLNKNVIILSRQLV